MDVSTDFASSSSGLVNDLTVEQNTDLPVWPQIDNFRTYNDQVATFPHAIGAPQTQSYDFQLESSHCDIDIDPSGLFSTYPSFPVCQGSRPAEELREENVGAPGVRIEFEILRPKVLNEAPIEHRRDTQVVLGVSFITGPEQEDLPWNCIIAPNIEPMGYSRVLSGQSSLDLALEVHGATTGRAFVSACDKCSTRTSSASPNMSLFDFNAKDGQVQIKDRQARVAFRFLCLPGHHGTADAEYRLSATISNCGQILGRHTFSNWFRVVSRLNQRRNIPSATLPQASEASGDDEVPPTAHIPDYSALDTPAGDGQCFVPAQPPCISAQIPSSDTHAPIPIIHKVSAPRRQQSTLPAPTAANHESIDEELPVLSHVNPRRGSTSGGDEIYLVVRNLPPTAVLYARFGSNIAATSHIAHGVLTCRLPPAAHPGVVDVTMCQAPFVSEEAYGESLASFEYEADTSKAVALLIKLLDGRLLMEAMPLIQKLLQRDTQGPRTGAHSMSSASSFPESAFLEALTAFKSLPDFEQRLSTVNGHGQSLLHLAVHLRYRELVQRLVDWGIELNTNDVNGFTALDAAYLCNDSPIARILEKRGAITLILDELGQPLTEPDVMMKAILGANQETNQTKFERADLTHLSLDKMQISTNLAPEGSRAATEVPDAPRLNVSKHIDGCHSPELYSSDNIHEIDEPANTRASLDNVVLSSNPSVANKESGRGSYLRPSDLPARRGPYALPAQMSEFTQFGQWMDGRHYCLEILQNPVRGRACGFGDKDRTRIAPALIAKLVVNNPDHSPVVPEEIDPSFFVVMVDLWSENGKEERTRVRNLTVQRGGRRQDARGSRPESTFEPATIAPSAAHDPSIYSNLFSPPGTTSSLGGSSSTSLHAGSRHASPIEASPRTSSPQQGPIPTSPWGATELSQYSVPPLTSYTAPSHSAQGSARIQYAPIEAYETLTGTSISTGVHIEDDQGETNVLFVFPDLVVRTEGVFRLRLRLSSIGSFNPTDGSNTGRSFLLAQLFSEPFTVFNSKEFPGIPAITELSKAMGIQAQTSQKHSEKGKEQWKSGTMYLNEFQHRNDEDNTVEYEEYKCSGFTENNPLYGCLATVNGTLMGQSDNHPNQRDARNAAACQAAKALGLVKET